MRLSARYAAIIIRNMDTAGAVWVIVLSHAGQVRVSDRAHARLLFLVRFRHWLIVRRDDYAECLRGKMTWRKEFPIR